MAIGKGFYLMVPHCTECTDDRQPSKMCSAAKTHRKHQLCGSAASPDNIVHISGTHLSKTTFAVAINK